MSCLHAISISPMSVSDFLFSSSVWFAFRFCSDLVFVNCSAISLRTKARFFILVFPTCDSIFVLFLKKIFTHLSLLLKKYIMVGIE